MRALLRALVVSLAVTLAVGGTVACWLLVRPLGWVYALAVLGLVASAVVGATLAARGSALGRWLMED